MIKLEPWTSIDGHEERAAIRVLRSGPLSGFLGGVLEGGPEVCWLEKEWSETFGGEAVSVNSATSGILIALKACGVKHGSQVICSPYSMSAGVAAIMWCGARPVFVDIDDRYCLDPEAVKKVMGGHINAILTTNLFGYTATCPDVDVPIIEDNAQAIFSHEPYGDILIESLNVHKPLQAGEGGICVTHDRHLARKLKLLRNHGEMAGEMPGMNFRMTEIIAAIAREQLKKGRRIVTERNALMGQLIRGIHGLGGVRLLDHDPTSTYYALPLRVHAQSREQYVRELNARGVPVTAGYGAPLYHLPAFKSFAMRCPHCELLERETMLLEVYKWKLDEDIINQMIKAFKEVFHDVS